MSHWGTSFYPNRFLESTIKIRRVLSSLGVGQSTTFNQKTSRSHSPTPSANYINLESTERSVKVYSGLGFRELSLRALPRQAFSSTIATESSNTYQPQKNIQVKSEIGIVTTNEMIESIPTNASVICLPTAILGDTYIWKCYEVVNQDDNTSELD